MENMPGGRNVKSKDAAKAKGVMQEMETEKFVRFLHFMLDYSTILSKCCTDFQHANEDGSIFCCGTQQPVRRGEGQTKTLLVQRLLTTQSCIWITDNSVKNLSLSRANYGEEEVDYLVTHFANLLYEEEKEKIPQEWMDLKMCLAEHLG